MNFLIYTGKSYTMMGNDVSAQSLGIMPCAIAWLFRLIDEQKEKTGARFSVRVSAVEVSGKNEQLKDLLADVANCKGTLLITCFCHFFCEKKSCHWVNYKHVGNISLSDVVTGSPKFSFSV